jgi:hypothetical protein
MPTFLDPSGQPTFGIGICDRCARKFPLAMLAPDRDKPGLMVCAADNDKKDPWREPFTPVDADISLPFTRPDETIDESYRTIATELGQGSLSLATQDGKDITI